MSYFQNDHGMTVTSLANLVRVLQGVLVVTGLLYQQESLSHCRIPKLDVQIGDAKMHGIVNVGLS